MIRVAICDDDVKVVEDIYKFLRYQSVRIEILTYLSGQDFLRDIDRGEVFDIGFIDIQMSGLNGVEVGAILRDKPDGDDMILIYISSHEVYYRALANIGSFRFIKKPIEKPDLDDVFNRALRQALKRKPMQRSSIFFRYRVGVEDIAVNIDDIAYLKNVKRTIELHIWNHATRVIRCENKFYAKIEEALEQFPRNRFVRCERSYIVNLQYVAKIEGAAFLLKDVDKTRVPISRLLKEETKKVYFKHVEDMA
ncbi:MAG: LytTR family DNA-binding domain-containing protein [Oscillospiraceae bacterium]|nr:LytTR family DNA-binding domain-containing protein [Oscillospiraceae bacterium]